MKQETCFVAVALRSYVGFKLTSGSIRLYNRAQEDMHAFMGLSQL